MKYALPLAAALLLWLALRRRRAPKKDPASAARLLAYMLAAGAVFLIVCMVVYPEVAFTAAVRGLKVWWEIVFPALLPFFIGAEVLMGLGVVHFMGVLLEPAMRPVFNVPGAGSFVMAMGLASGYPIGSILTARLRRQNLCSKTEAERLMSFTNTADPLFMVGAVAVGMFRRPELGVVIAASHYISSVSVGLVLRFYRRNFDRSPPEPRLPKEGIFTRALRRLFEARVADGRPFGQLLGDAVRTSVNNLLLIGGFIILFSSLIDILTSVGVAGMISGGIMGLLEPLGVHRQMSPAIVSGLFEITLGTDMSARAAAPLTQQVTVASAIIAWSGLSVHAQVASMIRGTDIHIGPYIAARALHAILAAIVAAFLMGPAEAVLRSLAVPVFLPATAWTGLSWTTRVELSCVRFLGFTAFLLAACLVAGIAARARIFLLRWLV